jgi:hypothetical protein
MFLDRLRNASVSGGSPFLPKVLAIVAENGATENQLTCWRQCWMAF